MSFIASCLCLSFVNNGWNNTTTPTSNHRLWLDSGQILCHQYGISVAESQTFLFTKRTPVAMSEEKRLVLQAIKGLAAKHIGSEQTLQGALVAGREKEGELATTSLEFEYLHWKSQCKMLIGGDDISNVSTLGACFYMFFNVCLYPHSFPLCTDWWKSDSSVTRGIEGGIQIPET